jgi:hypothetical protein
MTYPHCSPRLAKDLEPEPWYGDRLVYDLILAGLFLALALVALALI